METASIHALAQALQQLPGFGWLETVESVGEGAGVPAGISTILAAALLLITAVVVFVIMLVPLN